MAQIRVLGICGSMRSRSATATAVGVALEGAKASGAEIDFLDLVDLDLPMCDAREDDASYPASVHAFRARVAEAQGIILGTPEYHNSLTGALKNALDLCSRTELEHKMVGVIGVAGGSMGATNSVNHLRTIMRSVGAWVVPHQVSIGHAGRVFYGPDGLDPEYKTRLEKLGADVTKFARLLAAGIINADDVA
ncbi:MAG: NADPH-dependent FMN reductase [Candidatus Kapaibacterium sp.]